MALSDNQKKGLIIGVGVAAVLGIVFWSRRSSASPVSSRPIPGDTSKPLPAPSAGGGMPSPSTPVFSDPATGVAIEGPSTQIVAPPVGAQDTIRTVERGESWSNMASRAYGDFRWWPYIWDYNRAISTQFNDPDKLNRGDTVRIPPPPPMDPAFRDAIFARTTAHREYWLCKQRASGCVMDPIVYERTPMGSV